MSRRGDGRPWRLSHDARILLMALAAGLPGAVVCVALLWSGDYTPKVQWTLALLVVAAWLGFSFALRERVVYPLQTLSNLLAALREGDYSIRARGAGTGDALGEVIAEMNALGGILREQRLRAFEATALLGKVMEEIDVAVFTFDDGRRLRLLNRTAERLLAQPSERLIGRDATALGLAGCLEGEPARTLQMSFPGRASGRWGMRRTTFRERGLPHELLVLSDLTRILREEELLAWKRLVRVLGHELNNSLTPIKSIAGSLERLLSREPRPADWEEDMRHGLAIIASRSESLSRFMEAYARLARLPQPKLQKVDAGAWIRRVAGFETRIRPEVLAGPEITIPGDPDQLEQLLINLVRNAVDAASETGGAVRIRWRKLAAELEVMVEDEGPGLSDTSNLFVPFFTTKPGGSGIGLVLSRQIAEAHGGSLTLENREDSPGCVARLRIPL